MAGLPPVPSNVGQLTQEWEFQGLQMTTSWWVIINLPEPYDPLAFSDLLSDYTLYALPNLLEAMTSEVSPSTCRLAASGLVVTEKNPPASGAFDVTEAVSIASGIYWRTASSGRRGWSITYLPGTPHDFIDFGSILSAEGYGNIQDAATNFRLQMATLPSFPDQTLVLGTLHRKRDGGFLPASVFDPFIDVRPCPKVVRISRRIPRGRRVSPF